MSFTTSIYGNAPPNTFVYTTTTVSVNSISVENLSATNASIANLTTTLFSPVNVNASNVVAKTINSSTGNFSTATANNFIGTTGTIQTVNATYLNSSLANISTINASDVNSSSVNSSNIGCNFIAASNAYIDEAIGTNISYTNVSCNSLTANSGTFNTLLEVDGELTIGGTTTANTIVAIDVLSNNISAVNISATTKLTALNISSTNISCTTLTASGNIKGNLSQNLLAGAGIQLTTTAGITSIINTGLVSSPLSVSIINSSTLNSSIINSSTITGNIGDNLIAGTGISLSTNASGKTTISNIAQVSDPLNLSTLNSSTVNASNVSSVNVLALTGGFNTINGTIANISNFNGSNANISNLSVKNNINCSGNIFTNSVYGTYFDSSNGYIGILNTGTITNTNLNSSSISTNTLTAASAINSATANISNFNSSVSNCSTGNFSTITSTAISTPLLNASTINSSILYSNISPNLAAGDGITLNTLNNITTIQATGGLATSTQYCFQVYGNQGDYVINAGQVVPNNLIETCFPDFSAYNTGNYRYTVQVSGFYQMGFKVYFRNNAGTGPARFAIYKNEDLLGLGGQDVGTTETFTLIRYCNAGDYLTLRCFLGSLAIYQGLAHNWFYGYLLQPKNNTITESTALSISSLNTTLINASTINNSTLNSSIANISTVNATTTNSATIATTTLNGTTANISTINNSTLNSSIANISTINNSTLNSSTINTSTLTTNGMTSTDLINGTDIILSSTLEVAGGVIAYQLRGDSLRIRSSNPVTYSDAIVNKFNNTVNIAGGSGLDPGTIQFSTNGINYDMVYDGNLNLINALNAGIVNAGFLNGNLSNNLIAGTNITLSTSPGGVTTISASGGSSTPNFFYASLLANVNMGGTSFLLNPTTITSNCLNAGITYSGGVVGIQQNGYYRVSAQLNYYNGTTLRASGELAALLNNVELGNYPKGYSYARSGEGRSAGAGFSDWIVFLNNGDNVRFLFTVALATSGTFNGSLSGFVKLPGSYISVTKM